jgi:hypothetical protein
MIQKTATALLCLLCLVALAACETGAPKKPVACAPPTGIDLNAAIAQTQSDLSMTQCHYMFDAYLDNLLAIAQGNPNIENKQKFSEFLVWANTQGILTRVQAENHYNRFFNITFVCLPDDYNVCSVCNKQPEIERNMAAELRDKEVGLLKACRDKDSYYTAYDQYETLRVLLEATCQSCNR